jgi:LacI family transcriptional regulator
VRRFEHFGYFGSERAGFSRHREKGFAAALQEAGHTVDACHAEYLPRPASDVSWKQVDRRIGKWLAELPKPVAIMASNDVPARALADMCRQLAVRVPEEVAIVGVDNDEVECRLAHPPISSVQLPSERIGYEAAKLLDRLMAGESPPVEPTFLAPLRVVTRQSTDVFAVEDPDVQRALALIRERCGENIGIDAVARHCGTGRRRLERQFRKSLGRTILDEIRRMRIQRASELLVSTNLPTPQIAEKSGFSNARRFAVVFRECTGETPSSYRNRASAPE